MTNQFFFDIICGSSRNDQILGCRQAVRHQTLTLTFPGFESLHPSQKNSSDLFRGIFLSNPKDWYGINALARCMKLRRSRAWHRAKRVSKLVLLRIDAIHHFVMIPYDCFAINSIPQQVADSIHAFGVIWSECQQFPTTPCNLHDFMLY